MRRILMRVFSSSWHRWMVGVGVAAAVSAAFVSVAQAATAHRAVVGTHYAKIVADCTAPSPGDDGCYALRRVSVSKGTTGAQRYVVRDSYPVGPADGYTPSDLWSAYGLGTPASLTAAGGPGTGQTVGIVDAYDDPDIEADLGTFDAQYELPACTTANGCFEKVSQTGSRTALPAAAGASGWDGEIALDVETVHSVCPDCTALLVEANTASSSNLGTADNEAVALGATEVSNSYGGAEQSSSSIQADYTHPGVVITASAGDNGYHNWTDQSLAAKANTPAAFPQTVAVGGTALQLNSDGSRASETVWNDETGPSSAYGIDSATGGGCSALFTAQTWQSAASGYAAAGCAGHRLVADISAIGDPITGFDTYDSYTDGSQPASGWATTGGTSLSSPVVAAMFGLAGGAQGVSYPSQTLYSGLATDAGSLYDVTGGGNGYCYGISCTPPASRDDCDHTAACDAEIGLDGPGGIGSPVGLAVFSPSHTPNPIPTPTSTPVPTPTPTPTPAPIPTPTPTRAPTPTPAPAPAPAPAAGMTAAQIAARLAEVAIPHGKGSHIGALLKKHGFMFAFTWPEVGFLRTSWYVVATGARRPRRKPKPVLVATGAVSIKKAGRVGLSVKLTAAGKVLLKHAGDRLALTSTSQFTSGHATTIVVHKRFTAGRE
jgi:hypothetical protein